MMLACSYNVIVIIVLELLVVVRGICHGVKWLTA